MKQRASGQQMRGAWAVALTIAILVLLGCATTKGARQDLPDAPQPAAPSNGPAQPPVQQEILERGGTLQEWQESLDAAVGPDSAEAKTTAECKALMEQKVKECEKRPAWSVDNAIEIVDMRTGRRYEFQDVKQKQCPDGKPPTKDAIHIDTASLDAQTDSTASSYQVLCTLSCNWWECERKPDLTGTWEGEYTDLWGSKYCQFKETGITTFEIKMDDETSFKGTTRYNGQNVIVAGEHCQGGPTSGEGTISGSVSEDKVSGTIVYSTSFPFTATLSDDTLTGSYSYTFTEAGTAHSGKGEYRVTRK
jgi:hypothetical protein